MRQTVAAFITTMLRASIGFRPVEPMLLLPMLRYAMLREEADVMRDDYAIRCWPFLGRRGARELFQVLAAKAQYLARCRPLPPLAFGAMTASPPRCRRRRRDAARDTPDMLLMRLLYAALAEARQTPIIFDAAAAPFSLMKLSGQHQKA